jgi:prolyl 4-hydroxylase
LRFYRYSGDQYFKWHHDGSYSRNENEESYLTFIIYLNEEFDEGYTQFPWEKIYPRTGMALVFPHNIRHRAVPALHGVKYVLRTDVIYKKAL